jgi:hypothetical protein
MARLGLTWGEAIKGRNILLVLRNEACSLLDEGMLHTGTTCTDESPAVDLNDWLGSNDLWSMMSSDPAAFWDTA